MSFLLSKAFGLSEWPFIWPSVFIFIFGALSKHPCVYYHLIYKGNTEASTQTISHCTLGTLLCFCMAQGGGIGMYLLIKHVFNPDSSQCADSNYFSQMDFQEKKASFFCCCSCCFSITNNLSHIKHAFQRRMAT